jgi:tetratricopeptide (TPR) repeat protein
MDRRYRVSISIVIVAGLIIVTTATASDGKFRGLFVEGVARNCAVEETGLRNGDILLEWSRGGERGELHSPFDVPWLEAEQSPRGAVTLTGFRRSKKRTWVMGPGCWGSETRPQMPEGMTKSYEKGRALARAGKVSQAAAVWTAAGRNHNYQTWLGAWFMLRAATLLSKSRRWSAANSAYEESIARAGPGSPAVRAQVFLAWARTYRQRDDWENSEKYCLRSIVENQKVGAQTLSIADALDELGTIFLQRRNLVEAEAYFGQAFNIRETLAPDSLAMAHSLSSATCASRSHRSGYSRHHSVHKLAGCGGGFVHSGGPSFR